jgi:hypothetical protein
MSAMQASHGPQAALLRQAGGLSPSARSRGRIRGLDADIGWRDLIAARQWGIGSCQRDRRLRKRGEAPLRAQ